MGSNIRDPGLIIINDVVLVSIHWISTFCVIALIIGFFLQTFYSVQYRMTKNCHLYRIIVPIVKGLGALSLTGSIPNQISSLDSLIREKIDEGLTGFAELS